MLSAWLTKNNLDEYLIPSAEFAPFPNAANRVEWEAIDSEKRVELIKNAEKFEDYIWPALNAVDFMAYERTGSRVAYEDKSFPRRTALSALVLGECAEGKGRFLDQIINGIWCICEETYWGVSATNCAGARSLTDPLPDVEHPSIDLFAAETAGLMAYTSYLLKPRLDKITPLITGRIAYELNRRIKQPFLMAQDYWWMGYHSGKVNNWNPWILSNVIAVFLLNEPDEHRRIKGITKSMECLNRFLSFYDEDGGCEEGSTYWNIAGGSLFDCLFQLDAASDGKIAFWQENLIQQIGKFVYRNHIAGSYFINFADADALTDLDKELVFRYGEKISDPKMMSFAAEYTYIQNYPTQNRVSLCPFRRYLPAIFGYEKFKQFPKALPFERDVFLKGIELMIARENTGTEKGLYLAAKGGYNDESHNHNDVGSCIVYADGEPALIDVGVETYTKKTFSAQRYDIWTMQSNYHNLPLINGVGQSYGANYKSVDVAYESTDKQAVFSLDIHGAYPKEAEVTSYNRCYKLNRGENSCITITDTYEFSKQQNTLALHFMTWKEPKIDAGNVLIPIGDKMLNLSYDSALFEAQAEAIGFNDDRLRPNWGDKVYRIILNAKQVTEKGQTQIKIFL